MLAMARFCFVCPVFHSTNWLFVVAFLASGEGRACIVVSRRANTISVCRALVDLLPVHQWDGASHTEGPTEHGIMLIGGRNL